MNLLDRLNVLLCKRQAMLRQLRATEQQLDATRSENATLKAVIESWREACSNLNRSCRDLLEMGCQLQQERDEARLLAHDTLVVAGFAQDWADIRHLPEYEQ